MDTKEFKSPSGKEIYVAMTSGHTFRITDWRHIPEFAWRECYALGCVSKDQAQTSVYDAIPDEVLKKFSAQLDRHKIIKDVLVGWLDNNEVDKFTASTGLPNTMKLKSAVGFTIDKHEILEIFTEVQQEMLGNDTPRSD